MAQDDEAVPDAQDLRWRASVVVGVHEGMDEHEVWLELHVALDERVRCTHAR